MNGFSYFRIFRFFSVQRLYEAWGPRPPATHNLCVVLYTTSLCPYADDGAGWWLRWRCRPYRPYIASIDGCAPADEAPPSHSNLILLAPLLPRHTPGGGGGDSDVEFYDDDERGGGVPSTADPGPVSQSRHALNISEWAYTKHIYTRTAR